MKLEKIIANTDSIYCADKVSSNQSSVFIASRHDKNAIDLLNVKFGEENQITLRINKANLLERISRAVVDKPVYYTRKGERWQFDAKWFANAYRMLENLFGAEDVVSVPFALNVDETGAGRVYLKGLADIHGVAGKCDLRLFLFSGDRIVLERNGDDDVIDFAVRARGDDQGNDDGLVNEPALQSHGPLQLIRYGAPGTGKSHKTDEVVKTHKDTVRTTFHPDSDYSSFVGCYKPMKAERPMYGLNGETTKRFQENGKDVTEDYITYKFIPQAFAKAYVRAWRKMAEDGAPQFLVIEEINRGNCAQVFGDLFQLLDRDEAGMSKYPIEGEADFAAYLKDELRDIDCTAISNLKFAEDTTAEEVISGAKLVLPPNLHIWATMNTSDQSLFPMDSAFKRRWEWEYVPVGGTDKGWRIVADGTEFRWTEFLDKINAAIFKATQSEDKQLGHFFAKAGADGVVPLTSFVNKVLFFVFNDVLRDYDLPGEFSRSPGGPKFAFKDFFTADGSPNETEVKALLTRIVGHSESTAAH